MKPIKLTTIFFILLFITSACATAPRVTPEKYNLDDQLEPVSEIVKFNFVSWDVIDNQSFILEAGASRFYLIVLDRPSDQLKYVRNIRISQTGTMLKRGVDTVTVSGSQTGGSEGKSGGTTGPPSQIFVIDKIYALKDLVEVWTIRDQLTK